MTPSERQPLARYLATADPVAAPLPAALAAAANQALRGIQTLTIDTTALTAALKTGGMPCTLDEMARRFSNFLSTQMRGHDRNNTRLTIDDGV